MHTGRSGYNARKFMLMAFIVLGLGITALWRRLPIDDAYITYRYAQNLSAGVGFVYNVNEAVLGTTTPLWGLILAGAQSIGVSHELASLVLGAAATALVVWLFLVALAKIAPFKYQVGWAFLILAYYPLSVVTFSGMETTAYSLTVGIGLYLFSRERPIGGALCAALATLLRPDGVLVLVVGLLGFSMKRYRGFVSAITLYGALILPSLIAANTMYGSILPHSIPAKRLLYPATPGKNLLYFFEALSQTPLDAIVLCVGGAGLVLGLKSSALRPFAVWAALYSAGIILSGVKPIFFWYFGPLWFLFSTVGIEGIRAHLQTLPIRLPSRPMVVGIAALLAFVFVRDTYVRFRALDAVEVREVAYRDIVHDFGSRILPGASVLVGETGILGYGLPQARIIDSSGIASPGVSEILAKLREPAGAYADIHRSTQWAKEVIVHFSPQWIIGARGRMQLTAAEEEEWFTSRYERMAIYTPEQLGGVAVYRRR